MDTRAEMESLPHGRKDKKWPSMSGRRLQVALGNMDASNQFPSFSATPLSLPSLLTNLVEMGMHCSK